MPFIWGSCISGVSWNSITHAAVELTMIMIMNNDNKYVSGSMRKRGSEQGDNNYINE